MDYKNLLQSATTVAKEAGEILKKYWGHVHNIQQKTDEWDLVTEADQAADQWIQSYIRKNHPTHSILSEEMGAINVESSTFTWVVDPLDGTTNYTHQFPFVAVSIGILHQGKPVIGVVYNPIMQELFTAAKGEGAFLNHKKIHVSSVKSVAKSLLATGFAYDRRNNPDNNYREFCHMMSIAQGIRRAGAASLDLAYVAAGRIDGYWERGLKPWDMAAGIALILEAGGTVTSYEAGEWELNSGRILASNGHIHQELSQELSN